MTLPSTSSACTSRAYVLQAIGLSREAAYSTLRVGIGRFTTREELTRAAALLVPAYRDVAARSSLDG